MSRRRRRQDRDSQGGLGELMAMYQQFSPEAKQREALVAAQLAAQQQQLATAPERSQIEMQMLRAQLAAAQNAQDLAPEFEQTRLDLMRQQVAAQKMQTDLYRDQASKAGAQADAIDTQAIMSSVLGVTDNPNGQQMLVQSTNPKIAQAAAQMYPLMKLPVEDRERMRAMSDGKEPNDEPVKHGRFLAELVKKSPPLRNTFGAAEADALKLYEDYMTLPPWIDTNQDELRRAQLAERPEDLVELRKRLARMYDEKGNRIQHSLNLDGSFGF